MVKFKVNNKENFVNVGAEYRLTDPLDLQKDLEEILSKVEEGKAFIRPSGTEDILRLYCEAKTTEQVDFMEKSVRDLLESKYATL